MTPNWFAAVMGTGIVANAAVLLPIDVPGRHALALAFWLLAVVLLAGLTATAGRIFSHLDDPRMAPFLGAPPMAFLTIGAGALLAGPPLLGAAAVPVATVLWTIGTVLGLASALTVPYLMLVRHDLSLADAFGGWLIPVVPPMVSAATGAALVDPRICWALFALGLAGSVTVITLVIARVVHHGLPDANDIPALWIVLGPLGQSVTAAGLLGGEYAVLYGAPVLVCALAYLAVALSITLRTPLPFSPTWWAFTFPVGTCATGASVLAADTGLVALDWLAVALFAGLLCGWLAAARSTAAVVTMR